MHQLAEIRALAAGELHVITPDNADGNDDWRLRHCAHLLKNRERCVLYKLRLVAANRSIDRSRPPISVWSGTSPSDR